jgi:ABC-2 type transport system permease protein
MKTVAALVRREFWEHRVLVWVPLILCIVYLIACVVLSANFGAAMFELGNGPSRSGGTVGRAAAIGGTIALPLLISALMAIVVFFYLCDSLYTERKDRSILFWKSLPVSDATTVLSKMLVALIAVPVLVYVLSFVTNLLAMMVFKVGTGVELFAGDGTFGTWLRINGYLLAGIVILALWYAPIVAYQLLISVSVPRVPMVWTLVPPLALIFGERLFLGTWRIGLFVLDRLSGLNASTDGGIPYGRMGPSIASFDPFPMLMRPGLWGGVLVAAVLTYAAIRIRRHSSDS